MFFANSKLKDQKIVELEKELNSLKQQIQEKDKQINQLENKVFEISKSHNT